MRPEFEHISATHSNRSFYWFEEKKNKREPFWHYHPELELTFCFEGTGTRFIGNSIENYTDKDLVLVGSNMPHHWVSSDLSTIEHSMVIQFRNDIFEHLPECKPIQQLIERSEPGLKFKMNPSKLASKFASFKPDKPLDNLMILLEILNVLSKVEAIPLSSRLYKASKSSDHRLSKITNHVLNNLNEKLSVDSVADLANMTSPAFCRWFKKSSGNTFIDFVNKSRIESACHHLVGSDKSMKEIAFLCGFESPNHFNHTFKKYVDMSPTHYRSENLV